MNYERTLGSICAGIGGFDIGFERAGWKTAWGFELDDVNRACLTDRFPHAQWFKNLNDWRRYKLPWVRCLSFGFPCQDISNAGNASHDRSRRGLAGSRSGLFFEIMEIVKFIQPEWLVVENVPALLTINEGRDIQTVIGHLRECGYLGYGRVLDAQYFGIPQRRRRLVMVAGLGRYPTFEFLADAAPVEAIHSSFGAEQIARPSNAFVGHTLTAPKKYSGGERSKLDIGSAPILAEENGWNQMVERGREVEICGFRAGLDASDSEEAYAAGNSFAPPVAKWVAEILNRS